YSEKNDIMGMARLSSRIFNLLSNAPKIPDHPYWTYKTYDSFEKILEDVKLPCYSYDTSKSDYYESTYYGWMAQICAGAVGTAIEGYTTENIRKVFGEINGYVRKPNTYNDDITYEFAFLKALERKRQNLTAADIAEEWVALVPMGWSAEDVALKNIKLGIYPPESGYMNNPYREWIGAQMRGAICGMVAPGNLQKAARYAYMDGTVSHYNNGVLGEVFNALLVSLAYVKDDVREILEEVIECIPKYSEYYEFISTALEHCKTYSNWEEAWKACQPKFIRYNWIHAYPNAMAEVIALWYGEGDFDKTMHIICMQGYDVDCNAAQIATVIGIINREKTLSEKWTEDIGDTLYTYLRNYKELSIKELAKLTVSLGSNK
ncbi:MAG TPA: ADP-ribosylglycohydrolase family protein, partial [Clostridiales bacterium]|nr:ADP-ribosylglycohydrolase family protein [Clostridiales bacterium]